MLSSNYALGLASMAFIGGVASAPALGRRAEAGCSTYVIVNARGTSEHGDSPSLVPMNQQILSAVPGGTIYDVNYPADPDQQTASGTADVVRFVTATLNSDPSTCFILDAFSQGSTVITDALPRLTGAAYEAVKFVYLLGNPEHNPNLPCNVDEKGGSSTAGASGQIAEKGRVPSNWYSKTRDVCYTGDGVCDRSATPNKGFPGAITPAHGKYGSTASVQSMGLQAAIRALQG
ncbi:carbohydrate esterase family 5 protein [Zymoseptoria brevis]|uniref:Carbohydrate esterase family 5 protein n=1 Tax=Zymoseptoria brevis TaxID=1047168 RepID=A0A0F4GGI6_9PEZI|nr:carbohydrate esterase family 5 protein [Zymoseptoria brevis]